MSPDRRRLRLIRERLVALYDKPDAARRIATDAGIDASHVDFHGTAQDFWFSLLGEATRAGKLDALLDQVRTGHPDDELLTFVQPEEAELPPVPDVLARAGVWRQLLVVLGPRLGSSLVQRLVERAQDEDAIRWQDKPYQLRTFLRRQWPGDTFVREVVATLEALDDDLRRARGVVLGMLAQVPGARFVATMPERTFERVSGRGRTWSATDVHDSAEVHPGDVVRTRGDRRNPKDLERLLGADRVDWLAGPPEAESWRSLLRRWFEGGHCALLMGFDGEQTEKALEELRSICGHDQPSVYVLLDDEQTAPGGLSIHGDRVLVLKEGRLASLWVERLRNAIELKRSRDELKGAREVAAYYGSQVEDDFKGAVQRVRDALDGSRYVEARTLATALLRAAEERATKDLDRWRSWTLRCRLNLATAQICLQEHEDARETLREVADEGIATHDVKLQAIFAEQLAILGELDRAQQVLAQMPVAQHEDMERVIAARWRVSLARGEIPEGGIPKGNHILTDLAQVWFERGDLARCTEHTLQSLEGNTKPLDRLIASRLLLVALERTVIEDPPYQTPMPVSLRPLVVSALETNLHELTTGEPPFPEFQRTALVLARGFYELSVDPERLDRALRALSEMGERDEVEGKTDMAAFDRHLRDGREEQAREALPFLAPPWRRTHAWLVALARTGQSERALHEALELSPEDKSHGLMAGLIAGLLRDAGRDQEAIVYARRAFEEVPVRGARASLVECLANLRRFEEAEHLATPLADTAHPPWLWTFATIASHLRRRDAVERWRAVLSAAPKNIHARMCLASALQDRGQTEEAADEAWLCIDLGLEAHLTLEDLQRIAVLQRMAGVMTHASRLRRITEVIAVRFPEDARAEAFRFELLAALDFPDDLPPANHELLESTGMLHRASIPEFVEQRRQRSLSGALVHSWYRLGNLTFDAFSALVHVEPAALVRGFTEAAADGKALLSAPVRIGAELQPINLRGARVLLGYLELLLLQRFGLIHAFREALGPEGSIVVFHDVRDRIHESAAHLERSTQRVQLAECERLIDRIHRSPSIALFKDESSTEDEHTWAHLRGFALIEARTELTSPTDAVLLSPRLVADRLHRSGHIDAETHSRLLHRLAYDRGDDALPAQLPSRVAISYPALVSYLGVVLFQRRTRSGAWRRAPHPRCCAPRPAERGRRLLMSDPACRTGGVSPSFCHAVRGVDSTIPRRGDCDARDRLRHQTPEVTVKRLLCAPR